jgi:hypothetical protein
MEYWTVSETARRCKSPSASKTLLKQSRQRAAGKPPIVVVREQLTKKQVARTDLRYLRQLIPILTGSMIR